MSVDRLSPVVELDTHGTLHYGQLFGWWSLIPVSKHALPIALLDLRKVCLGTDRIISISTLIGTELLGQMRHTKYMGQQRLCRPQTIILFLEAVTMTAPNHAFIGPLDVSMYCDLAYDARFLMGCTYLPRACVLATCVRALLT